MNRRIIISEEEKKQIRTLHETQKKEVNYFQILESKVNRLIVEQGFTGQGKLPELKAGEQRGEGGQITSSKEEELKPYIVDLTANFPANVTKPYKPTPEDLKKLEGLVAWLNNPQLKTSSVEIKVNSGSSRTGNFEDNKRLAIERGQTGIDYIKNYLKGKIKTDVYDKIVFPEPNDSLANQGPKPGEATAQEYQLYQKFQIIANAKGTIETKSTRQVDLKIYERRDAPMSNGFSFYIGNGAEDLAKKLGINDPKSVETLRINWPLTSGKPLAQYDDSGKFTGYKYDSPYVTVNKLPGIGWVNFCVNGPESYTSGKYDCSSGPAGYRQVYAHSGGYPGKRWMPYPEIDDKITPEDSAFFLNNPYFPKGQREISILCYIAEGNEGFEGKQLDFYKTIESSPFCQTKYKTWPNFNYKLDKKEVPGPEVKPWYPILLKKIWYTEGTTNGGLWTIPPTEKADTTKG